MYRIDRRIGVYRSVRRIWLWQKAENRFKLRRSLDTRSKEEKNHVVEGCGVVRRGGSGRGKSKNMKREE